MLRETWEKDPEGKRAVNLVSYVIQMREKLQKMSHLVDAHMAVAQRHQKSWYDKVLVDKSARQGRFEPGQKVLVMLPTSDSKQLAKWQSPFKVQQQLGPTTYWILNAGRPCSNRVLQPPQRVGPKGRGREPECFSFKL